MGEVKDAAAAARNGFSWTLGGIAAALLVGLIVAALSPTAPAPAVGAVKAGGCGCGCGG